MHNWDEIHMTGGNFREEFFIRTQKTNTIFESINRKNKRRCARKVTGVYYMAWR